MVPLDIELTRNGSLRDAHKVLVTCILTRPISTNIRYWFPDQDTSVQNLGNSLAQNINSQLPFHLTSISKILLQQHHPLVRQHAITPRKPTRRPPNALNSHPRHLNHQAPQHRCRHLRQGESGDAKGLLYRSGPERYSAGKV